MQQHLIIVKSIQQPNKFSAMIDANPQDLSDFNLLGSPAVVVLECPVDVAIAAPDLLEACRELVSVICNLEDGQRDSPNMRRALAAIAKAQGGAK